MNDYMKKVFKVSLYGLKSNKIFIALMFLLSLCLAVIWNDFGGNDYAQVITAAMGILLPIIMFGYVQKRAECDFFNSMPIKRSQYFLGYLITCVISFLLVYIPINIVLIACKSHYADNFFQGFAVFFVMFAVTVLSVMLSGSLCSTLVTLLILNFVVYETAVLIFAVCQVDGNLYINGFENVINIFSPYTIIQTCYADKISILTVVLTLLMAVVNLVIAFFLHRYRKNESTVAIAFPKTRYIIQYMIMFMAALLVSSRDSMYYFSGESRTLSNFVDTTFRHSSFFPYTFIAIFFTFVTANIIFENTPRGAFKKLRHFFIFTLGYSAFYILIVGGLLYTSLPYTFVPFDSNLVLVTVYQYEEQGRVKVETQQDEYYYNGDYFHDPTITTRIGEIGEAAEATTVAYSEPPAANAPGYESVTALVEAPITSEPSDSYFENIMYDENELGKWYRYCDEEYTYYLRQTDPTIYAVTDKEYINYLCGRVREIGNQNYYILGHPEVLTDNGVYTNELLASSWDFVGEAAKDGVYMCGVQFFDLSGNELDKYISLMEQDAENIVEFEPNGSYAISTYIDSEEAYKEFRSHAAYIAVNPQTSYGQVRVYFNH